MTGATSLLPLLLLWNIGTVDVAAAMLPDVAAGAAGRLQADTGGGPERPQPSLSVEVVSSGRSCEVRVGGRLLIHRHSRQLGLHALSLNPQTGRITGSAAAPGGVPAGAFVELASFVAGAQPGRVIILCRQSEAEMALDELSDQLFRSLNASFATDLQARSALALVTVKGGALLGESYRPHLAALEPDSPAPSLRLAVSVPAEVSACQSPAPSSAAERRRRDFCEQYDGYGALCDCGVPLLLLPVPAPLPFADGELFPFPVLVVSGGRPRHLHRCLASLLANPGLDRAQLLVITGADGDDAGELRHLLQLLGISWHPVPAEPVGGSLHRQALQAALHRFPAADKLVLLEDSVEVSPDLLSLFRQTHSLLDADVSLYGVSAGNELGYRHAVGDRTAVYRVDSAPAGAWLLPRRVISEDLLPGWTSAAAAAAAAADSAAAGVGSDGPELSELLRRADIRLGRECVVPEVPRFYRFTFNQSDDGTDFLYHWDRAVSAGPPVTLRGVQDLVLPRYQRHLQKLINSATKLDGSQSRLDCAEIVPGNATDQTLLLFVRMVSEADSGGWQRAAACLGLWDRDARGHHTGLWQLRHAGGGTLLVIGVPFSVLAGHALEHGSGRMMLVSAQRSADQRRRGRWPPDRPRPGPDRLLSRYRLSAATAGLDRHQLEAALIRRGLLHQQDLDGDGDDGDLRLQDITSA